MPWIELNDGSKLHSPGEIDPVAFDAIADAVEKGGSPPNGFTLERMQQAAAPAYPGSQIYQDIAGPAATVRDVATQSVAGALNKVSQANMAGIGAMTGASPEQKAMGAEAMRPIAQAIAQQVVPQTPDQLVSTLALAALAPAGGATGALLRVTVPMMLGIGTRAALEDTENPALNGPTILGQIVGSVVGEGAGPALKQITMRKWLKVQQDKIGDEMAKALGEGVAQVSTVKHLKTADNFLMIMGDKSPEKTLFAKEAAKAMETAETNLSKGLTPAMAQIAPAQRQTALAMLEDAAGFQRQTSGKAASNVGEKMPDTLFKEALERKRSLWQEADSLQGHERHEAMKLHDAQSEKIRSSLATIDPKFADMYKAMNDQYRADMEVRDVLWRMKEAGAWSGGTDRAHFNPGEAASILTDSMGMAERTGFMGGADKMTQFLSGPSGVPGAMPMSHEGVMRMFLQLVTGAPSISAGGKTRTLTIPTAPVMASHARALSDYLASNVIRGMAEKVMGAQ